MDDEGRARVQRLISWVQRHKKPLCDDKNFPSAAKLASQTGKKASYWSDVLREKKPSFAAASARATEAKLGMPRLHLEGVGWPFEDVDQTRFDSLSARQKGRVEQALIDILDVIESERHSKHPGGE